MTSVAANATPVASWDTLRMIGPNTTPEGKCEPAGAAKKSKWTRAHVILDALDWHISLRRKVHQAPEETGQPRQRQLCLGFLASPAYSSSFQGGYSPLAINVRNPYFHAEYRAYWPFCQTAVHVRDTCTRAREEHHGPSIATLGPCGDTPANEMPFEEGDCGEISEHLSEPMRLREAAGMRMGT